MISAITPNRLRYAYTDSLIQASSIKLKLLIIFCFINSLMGCKRPATSKVIIWPFKPAAAGLNGQMITLEVAGRLQPISEFMKQKMMSSFSFILEA